MEIVVVRYHHAIANAVDHIVATADGGDNRGAFAAAIAICGTACEMAVAYALDKLLEADAERPSPSYHPTLVAGVRDLLDSPAAINLHGRSKNQQLALWYAVTGDAIPETWRDWNRYSAFATKRNLVVHRGCVDKEGNAPARADADEALSITRSLLKHVRAVMTDSQAVSWV